MTPLTDDEAALLYITGCRGIESYPVAKISGRWFVTQFRSWTGFPIAFKTKKDAVAQFDAWASLARERYAEMRRINPNVILTAVGILVTK